MTGFATIENPIFAGKNYVQRDSVIPLVLSIPGIVHPGISAHQFFVVIFCKWYFRRLCLLEKSFKVHRKIFFRLCLGRSFLVLCDFSILDIK